VDASPIFIQKLSHYQSQYYSGKFKQHCDTIQGLVTADGQCIHLPKVYRGVTHDKANFIALGWLNSSLIAHQAPPMPANE
jgi:hypothetical protein